jgi:hypothetical protein
MLSPVLPAASPLRTQIRPYHPSDKVACVKLYKENEPGRFTDGVVGQFEQFLEHPGYLKLVGCIDGKIIAIGGIGRVPFIARFGFVHQGQMALPSSRKRLDVKSALLDGAAWDVCRTAPRDECHRPSAGTDCRCLDSTTSTSSARRNRR